MQYKVIKGYKDRESGKSVLNGSIITIESEDRANDLMARGFIQEYNHEEGKRERGKPNYVKEDFDPPNRKSLYDKSLDKKEPEQTEEQLEAPVNTELGNQTESENTEVDSTQGDAEMPEDKNKSLAESETESNDKESETIAETSDDKLSEKEEKQEYQTKEDKKANKRRNK